METLMRYLLWAIVLGLIGLVVYQQRELQAARLRGDMYRDIAARLDKRVAGLTEGSAT